MVKKKYKSMNKNYAVGIDIGGTHITVAVIDITSMKVVDLSLHKECFDSNMPVEKVMAVWKKAIEISIGNSKVQNIKGLAICMPGPFDYEKGICRIKDQSKYEHFYGLNVRDLLHETLNLSNNFPILFENDAVCFGKGEVFKNAENLSKKVMAVTLGTGLGACFIDKGISISSGKSVPKDGEIWNLPYKNGIAEDYVSVRGLLNNYKSLTAKNLNNGLELFNLAVAEDKMAIQVFEKMGEDLALVVISWLQKFEAESFIIGGKIANANAFFLNSFNRKLKENDIEITVSISTDNEVAALLGASSLYVTI
jgi:glucokinase